MEITFVWSWASFWIGLGVGVFGLFIGMFTVAAFKYGKQRGKGFRG